MTARHYKKRATRRANLIAGADWNRILTQYSAPRRDWFTAVLTGVSIGIIAVSVAAIVIGA